VIASGETPDAILTIIEESEREGKFYPTVGTYFPPQEHRIRDRKWWILNGLASFGEIYIDAGAFKAIKDKNSLFAPGIVKVCDLLSDRVPRCLEHSIHSKLLLSVLLRYAKELQKTSWSILNV
jgi:glutamate 5-kinase